MNRSLVLAAVVGLLFAACTEKPAASVSPLWSGLSLLPIAQAVEREGIGIRCGPPGGGGGSAGAGPNGGGLVHHHASTTCTFPGGGLDGLMEPWGRLTGVYLESLGMRITLPGSFDGGDGDVRGFTWEYTSGSWTGVLAINIVPLGDDSYRVLADLVEYGPG
jgi:hypothetical protein